MASMIHYGGERMRKQSEAQEKYYDQLWADKFAEAEAYYQAHGNLRINIHNSVLGRWICAQRRAYANGKLKWERIAKLNRIGMIWGVHEADWEAMYHVACQYHEEHGHLDVPARVRYKDTNLGYWITTQSRCKDQLSEAQILRLEALGMIWRKHEKQWDEMYQLAKEYYEEHGNLLVNTQALYQGEGLGKWINKQRRDYMYRGTPHENFRFTDERIAALEQIGMVWNTHDHSWNLMYDVAKRYFDLHGNVDMSANYVFENCRLGVWLYNQKLAYKGKGKWKRTAERIEKLNQLHIKWD